MNDAGTSRHWTLTLLLKEQTEMDINTNINIEIDTEALYEEMEGNIYAAFEHLVGEWGLQDHDEVNGTVNDLIDEKMPDAMAEYAEAIELTTTDNVSEMITTALDDHDTDLNGELIDLRNEVEKARRSIRVLLEEREARLGMRIKRATHNIKGTVGRKVRRIKERLTRKD